MLIKNKLSREAFYAFLQIDHPGNDQYVKAYLAFEGIKKDSKKEIAIAKTKLCAAVYGLKPIISSVTIEAEKVENRIYLITQGMRDDIFSMSVDHMDRKLSQAQDEILLLLTPFYDGFLKSKSYQEFEITCKAKERRSYNETSSSNMDSVPIGRRSSDPINSRNTSDVTTATSTCTPNQNLMSRQTSCGTTISRSISVLSVSRPLPDVPISVTENNPGMETKQNTRGEESKLDTSISASEEAPESNSMANKFPQYLTSTISTISKQVSPEISIMGDEFTVVHLSTVPESAA